MSFASQLELKKLGPVRSILNIEQIQNLCKNKDGYSGKFHPSLYRLDATSSPLPGSLSSVGTPESLSSADSPGFTIRSLDSPSPGRAPMSVSDEPMHEERQPELSKQLGPSPS